MHYTIGEFAAMLGVTSDTLRLYEKHGIIKPTKDNKNNYRYYTDIDARNLLMSRWFRSMQIPLQEVALLMNEATLNDIIKKVEETQLLLEEEIKKSTTLLDKMVELNLNFKNIKSSLNKCSIRLIPGIYRLKQTNGDHLLKDVFLRDMVNTWMEQLPYTFYSIRIDKDEFLCEESRLEYSWGLAISEDELPKLELEINENVEHITQGLCISSIILTCEEAIKKDSLQFMLDYIKDNQFSIAGDIIGRIILTENVNNYKVSYLEVNIPVK